MGSLKERTTSRIVATSAPAAIETWVAMQQRLNVTIAEAALAFNTPADVIVEAVAQSQWAFVGAGVGPNRIIELDGE